MKKIVGLISLLIALTGCAETMALLGPASTSVGSGNVLRSSVSSVASYTIKKRTGLSPWYITTSESPVKQSHADFMSSLETLPK